MTHSALLLAVASFSTLTLPLSLKAHEQGGIAHANAAVPAGQTPSRLILNDETHAPSVNATGDWWSWDRASGDWLGSRNRLLANGIDIFGGYTVEVWSNVSGGEKRGTVPTQLFDFGVEIDLEKLMGWKGATLHNAWFAPLGRDLSADYVGNSFTVSNAAAYRSLYLFELWFQQNLWDDMFSIRFGQLAADESFAGTDYGALFLNATFGWPPFLSENLPNVGPAFPKGTLGVQIAITPVEWFTLQSAIFQGNPFSDKENRHGTRWKLGSETGYLLMNEAQFRWNMDAKGLPGQIKLGAWYQSSDTPDSWAGSTQVYSGTYGFYLTADQMVYRKLEGEDQGIGWFGRIATAPEDRSTIGFYVDTGLSWKGALPGRGDDTLGIAFAYGSQSRGAKRTLREEGAREPSGEAVIELTYQCQLNPWLTLQPDIQYIIHPGGTSDLRDAWVLGARATVTF